MKQNYLFFFVLFFLCKSLGFSQIVNEGTLKIMIGTNVYFGNDYTNKAAATHNNDGNLHLKGNFVNNGTTTVPNDGTTYFNSTVNAVQTISGTTRSANFYNLEVDNTFKGVSVADGFGLIVAKAVALNDTDLRLVGEAQLVQTHATANANTAGTGKLLRDQQGISSTTGYNYWSSPVNNGVTFALNGGLFYESTDPFAPTPFGFTPSLDGSAGLISERWLYKYSRGSGAYAEWDKINSTNSGLLPGEGFTMKGTGVSNQNYVFKGTPNNGDYSFSIAAGESILLGNPYPSALDSDKFIADNLTVIEDVQFWVDGVSISHYLANYLGGYSIYNLVGGVAPSLLSFISGVGSAAGIIPKQYIAVAQGFFVEATGAGTSIVFNNSQRDFRTETELPNVSNFYKNSNSKDIVAGSITDLKSYIRIGYEDPEMFHRQLLLGFLPDSPADLNYNRGYDALMSGPREDELFFIIENDLTKKYVIQGVNAFDENNEFDLGLMMTEAGVHTIMLDAVENFTGKVYIKDVLANITYDLTKGSFCPNLPPGTYLDRFKLVFTDKTATVVTEDLNPDFGIAVEKTTVYYHENESLIVRTKNDLKVNNITVYNTLGQQIKQVVGNELGKNVYAIPFHYPIGVYLVIVESELGKETFKIVNK